MDLIVEYTDERARENGLCYLTAGACGLDLCAARGSLWHANFGDDWKIPPKGGHCIIPCGVKVSIPVGNYGEIAMRSGHGFKRALVAFNGKIDSDYIGEIKVLVRNFNTQPEVIRWGERFAQLIIQPYTRVNIVDVPIGQTLDQIVQTIRGSGGFGSTGE